MRAARRTLLLAGLSAALLLALWAYGGGGAARQNATADATAPLADWMALLENRAPLSALALPGAHDAGTAGMLWAAETQRLSVRDQLRCGTRYFDLRAELSPKGVPRIFHGPVSGAPLAPLLGDVRAFLDRHPTEALALDFQHFRRESEAAVARQVERILGPRLLRKPSGADEGGFLADLRLADARGRCIVLWGSVRFPDWAFRRERALRSRYVESWHTRDSAWFLANALPHYLDTLGAPPKRPLTVLQTQLTDGWVLRGPLWLERRHAPALDAWIADLARHPRLPSVNIVLRDGVTPAKNVAILRLNRAKGHVPRRHQTAFAALTENVRAER